MASGSRAAGIVFALGYLLGIVPGPIVAALGGLALITFGRSLLLDRSGATLAALALAVVGGALGVGALRWSTLDLIELRGVQAVLGPTLWVGPDRVALAAGIASGAALLALGVWSGLGPRLDRSDRLWLSLEALVAALAVVTVFGAPVGLLGDAAEPRLVELGAWAAATLAVAVVVVALGWLLSRRGALVRGMSIGLSSAAAVAAAVMMVISL